VTAAAEVARALGRDKRTLARLVTAFEDPRPAACAAPGAGRRARRGGGAHGRVVGVTGTPGAGTSSLVGELAMTLVADGPGGPGLTVAVVAVDPSSPVSGGALLGDRTRVHFPIGDDRLYFRSQPSGGEVGGLARATFQACPLLTRLLNKIDLPGADATVHALRASLRLGAPGRGDRPVLKTSARSGVGVAELAAAVRAAPGPGLADRERAFFRRWVETEYGRWGEGRLARLAPDLPAYLAAHGGLDGAQLAFTAAMTQA
jgi:LAO/AO transport system kinase